MTEQGGKFVTFHLSGGTTEALLYDNGKLTILGQTLDLNAGQAVDRVGVMLGLDFPCGEALERLACGQEQSKGLKISVKGFDCNLAGLENRAAKMHLDGVSGEEIAAYTLDLIIKTVDNMTENILAEYEGLPVLYAGGVASCKRMADALTRKYDCAFASPELSGDNAVGVALLCRQAFMEK
jgi:N6-L-threonylcarbamoyladenine synthase